MVSKVLYLRQNYHFGPGKIRDYLRRFHRLSLATANQKHRQHTTRWKRDEKQQPGHRLQMDVKFLERIPGTRKRLYQFTAIDDCTRIGAEDLRRLQPGDGHPVRRRGHPAHGHLGELGIRLFSAKLREWQDFYNFHRPHGSLRGQTPYERLLEKTKAKRRAALSPRS